MTATAKQPVTNLELSRQMDAEILADRARRGSPSPRLNPAGGVCTDCGVPLIRAPHLIPAGHRRLFSGPRCARHYYHHKETTRE